MSIECCTPSASRMELLAMADGCSLMTCAYMMRSYGILMAWIKEGDQ
jgi:hypothetical protein